MDFSLYQPQNETELKNYLKLFANIKMPDVSVMPDTTPPFEFFSDIYFRRVSNAVVVAGRGTGKTQDFALLAWLLAKFNPNIEIDIVGAIMQQAKKAYGYVKKIAPKYSDCLSSLMSQTKFTNGSKIEILSGSISSLNSPHPQVAFYDEIELTDKEHLEEFENMPVSLPYFPKVEVLTSSLKYSSGLLSQVLEESGYEITQSGIIKTRSVSSRKVYLWTGFEATKRCTLPSCEQCKKIKRADGVSFYDICQGRLRNANGFAEIKDLQDKFLKLDPETFDSQILSRKPQAKNLVYPWINSSIEDFRIDDEYVKQFQIFGGLDFGGYPDPNVLILGYLKNGHIYIFKEIYSRKFSPSQFMEEIKKTTKPYPKVIFFADPSGKSFFREAMNHGLRFYDPITRNIEEGIGYINSLGMSGKIHIHKSLYYIIKELTSMTRSKRGIIRAPNGDHASDAARYMIVSAMTIYGGKTHVI